VQENTELATSIVTQTKVGGGNGGDDISSVWCLVEIDGTQVEARIINPYWQSTVQSC
jgi:hypothetical protein